jgi:hypothetical protein
VSSNRKDERRDGRMASSNSARALAQVQRAW